MTPPMKHLLEEELHEEEAIEKPIDVEVESSPWAALLDDKRVAGEPCSAEAHMSVEKLIFAVCERLRSASACGLQALAVCKRSPCASAYTYKFWGMVCHAPFGCTAQALAFCSALAETRCG